MRASSPRFPAPSSAAPSPLTRACRRRSGGSRAMRAWSIARTWRMRRSAASSRTCRSGSTTSPRSLLFFTLELNRIEDSDLAAKLAAPELAHYQPWLRDVRAFRPHQLSDELEKLLHEKSIAGRAAWIRLFEETIAGLRFPIGDKDLTSAEALHLLADPNPETPQGGGQVAGRRLRPQRAALRAGHQHARQGQGDRGPLARLQAADLLAQSRQFRRGRGRRCPDRRRARRLSDACRTAITGSRRAGSASRPCPIGTATRPCPATSDRIIPWSEAQRTVLDAYAAFSPELAADRPPLLRRAAGSTRRSSPASRRAPSPIRPCRASTPICCSIIWARCATS